MSSLEYEQLIADAEEAIQDLHSALNRARRSADGRVRAEDWGRAMRDSARVGHSHHLSDPAAGLSLDDGGAEADCPTEGWQSRDPDPAGRTI